MISISKNKFIKILIAVIITAVVFAVGPSYSAPDDLVIEFESTPLFSETNFLPGNEITRYAKVTNNTGASRDIITEAINVNDPDNFAGALTLTINDGGAELFNGSLADFFNAGEVALSSVTGGGGLKQYDFSIVFNSSGSNGYQENSLGFDILIGFAGDGGGGENGGGGGGGGGGGIVGLTVVEETVKALDVQETSTTITWDTSYHSTSRVVYGTIPGAFNFNNPPNYGYEFSTAELDTPASANGVFGHSVTISGLASGTTYYFRAISHASPDTLSFEYNFTTLGEKNSGQQTGQENVVSGNSAAARTSSGGVQTASQTVSVEKLENAETIQPVPEDTPTALGEKNLEKKNDGLLAFIGLGFLNSWQSLLIILIAILLVLVFWRRARNKKR